MVATGRPEGWWWALCKHRTGALRNASRGMGAGREHAKGWVRSLGGLVRLGYSKEKGLTRGRDIGLR